MKRWQLRTSDGFSLVEVLITVAIGGFISMYAASLIKGSMESNKLAKRLNVVNDLETRIMKAFQNERSIAKTKEFSKALAACLDGSGGSSDCNLIDAPLDLWLVSGSQADPVERKLTGHYDADLKSCTAGCPLELVTKFTADCQSAQTSCDIAASINLVYEIKLNGKPLKNGMLSRMIREPEAADTNYSCPADPEGLPTFVSTVRGSSLTCSPPSKPPRSLGGVTPGECVRGKEILAGFDANGAIVCVPITFSSK